MAITAQSTELSAVAVLQVLSTARKLAAKDQLKVAISVIDKHQQLKGFIRMDGAPAIATDMSQAKARAALMGLPSDQLGEALSEVPHLHAAIAQQGAASVGGGIPIIVNDEVIAAIGVGGATPDQDQTFAKNLLESLTL